MATQQHQKYHNREDCDNSDLELDYISEDCAKCHDEMININDIWVTTEEDQYICNRCRIKYRVNAVRCRELD